MNQLIVVDNTQNLFFPNLSAALLAGIARAEHDLIALVHEDVFLVDNWQSQFEASLGKLEAEHPDWGLVGSVGWTADEKIQGHWSDPHRPHPVDTFCEKHFCAVARLDEQILVLRREGDIRPDPELPTIHQLGIDLVHQQKAKQPSTFAINAPTIHKYADAQGRLIQTKDDSTKIKARSSISFKAEYNVAQTYVDHKHGLSRVELPHDPYATLTLEQQAILDAPLLMLGRGGGGTRLVSLLAQDCELFLGNDVNKSGDCMDMIPTLYRSVLRHLHCVDVWSKSVIVADIRSAAVQMLEAAGWPKNWGFKSPESVLILEHIRAAFPNARYVHFHRKPESTVFRRSHMTARFDNEIGRAAIPAAYDHLGIPRAQILKDNTLLHMAATTRHQNDLIAAHLSTLPPEDHVTLSFEQTLAEPKEVLAKFAEFAKLTPKHHAIVDAVNQDRAVSKMNNYTESEVAQVLELLHRSI
ncbi:MAG: sulfotransferase [Sulfitobacter sp.]